MKQIKQNLVNDKSFGSRVGFGIQVFLVCLGLVILFNPEIVAALIKWFVK